MALKSLTFPTILKLKAKGSGVREIANLYGVSFQAVSQKIKRGLPDMEGRCPQCLRKHDK